MNVFQWKAANLTAEGLQLPHSTANYGAHFINGRNNQHTVQKRKCNYIFKTPNIPTTAP